MTDKAMDTTASITRMGGTSVIAFAAWREAVTDEQRADLFEGLVRQRFRDAGDLVRDAGWAAFALAWLTDNRVKRTGFDLPVVAPGIAGILADRFQRSAHEGQGD